MTESERGCEKEGEQASRARVEVSAALRGQGPANVDLRGTTRPGVERDNSARGGEGARQSETVYLKGCGSLRVGRGGRGSPQSSGRVESSASLLPLCLPPWQLPSRPLRADGTEGASRGTRPSPQPSPGPAP